MNCPSCQGSMTTLDYQGTQIQECPSCGGEFMGAHDIVHIVNTRDERVDPEIRAQVSDWNPVFGVPEEETIRELTCPACHESMRVVNYAGDTGIFVDRCESCHGLWLDHEELEKVQALMERWADEAPAQIQALTSQLEKAERDVEGQLQFNFSASRFSFVNALLSRLIDAA